MAFDNTDFNLRLQERVAGIGSRTAGDLIDWIPGVEQDREWNFEGPLAAANSRALLATMQQFNSG